VTRTLNDPTQCFICRRNATGFGVNRGDNVGWLCLPCRDSFSGVHAVAVPTETFDRYERDALIFAGNEGGEYLDSVGITDLSQLPPEQYQRFLEIIIHSFGEGMRHACGVEA